MKKFNRQPKNIEGKLYSVKIEPDKLAHIDVDFEKCKKCKTKACTYFCPAKVYEWNEKEQKLNVRFESCLECGSCKIGCELKAITWSYPPANKGIKYKHS